MGTASKTNTHQRRDTALTQERDKKTSIRLLRGGERLTSAADAPIEGTKEGGSYLKGKGPGEK